MPPEPSTKVAAVIVTYRRAEQLGRTLGAVLAQSRPPDVVFVVDNGGDDRTAAVLANHTSVVVVGTGDNVGFGAGLAVGMERALDAGAELCWLLDDDSEPQPIALEALLGGAASAPTAAIIGTSGGRLDRGWIRHLDAQQVTLLPRLGGEVRVAGFVLVDGALVRRDAMATVGMPRRDLFLMLEDVEYSWRLGQAGYDIGLLPTDLMLRRHLGSADPGGAPWRRYYQARNHVRWAIDSGSWAIRFGCVARLGVYLFASVRHPWQQRGHLKLAARGVIDGLRGRMGRTVEPVPGTPS